MNRLARYALILGVITSMIFIATGVFAADNPCNPCGDKNPCNPCNPCGGKAMNPCNPCNPCSGMKSFTVNDPNGRDVFTFESKAPLEKIVGTSNKIMGHIQVNPKDITKGLKAMFELDLTSMTTGIGLRDQHMRDNFLETGKYPKAILTINKVTKASDKMLMDQKPIKLNAEGTLDLHGVKKPVQLKYVTVTYFKESKATKGKLPGDLLIINGGFSLKLPDHKIKVPQAIFLKLDKTIKVNVDLTGSTAVAGGANPCNPCNPCAGNPCNPCNPCAGKNACNPCKGKNPCNPCNPCGK